MPTRPRARLKRLVKITNRVTNSGKYNFELCRIPVPTGLNVDLFKWHLACYHDRQLVEFLEFGWPINCDGAPEHRFAVDNHKGAREYPSDIEKFLQDETNLGRVLGPFPSSPFNAPVIISPLNTTEKRDSTERRIILDLTYPGVNSVNTSISKDEYLGQQVCLKYPTVDDLIWQINVHGPGCLLFKRDLRKAYRQIPIDPGDVPKLAYMWRGEMYADRVLSMGLRSAAYICQRVSDSIMYIFRNLGYTGVVYLDDFAGVGVGSGAYEAFEALGKLLSELGLVESEDKACKPSTRMNFLGIWFCTESMTMRITPERLDEINQILQVWENKASASKKELQSIIGKLSFAAKCVRPGRLFLARMLNELRSSPDTGSFAISEDFKKEVLWWRKVMPHFNGVSIIPPNIWSEPDAVLACDACLTGAGGVCGSEDFHRTFPPYILDKAPDINQKELVTIMAALAVWHEKLRGLRVQILCDNLVTVQVMMSGRARNKFMQACLREITWLAAVHQFELQPQHIEGQANRVPDWLSRWHLDSKFKKLFDDFHEGKKMWEVFVPEKYFHFSNDW